MAITKKSMIAICLSLIGVVVLVFLLNYDFEVLHKDEPISFKPSKLSFMIMRGVDDHLIKSEIDKNPSQLNIVYKDEFNIVDLKTPLITAIVYKREELAHYMIVKGASVERTKQILEEFGATEYNDRLNEILRKK